MRAAPSTPVRRVGHRRRPAHAKRLRERPGTRRNRRAAGSADKLAPRMPRSTMKENRLGTKGSCMDETLSGVGRLRPEHPADPATGEFDVEYEIHISSRTTGGGLQPLGAAIIKRVSFVRATDGRSIPEGYYELQTKDEYLRLRHDFAGWVVL